MDPQHQHSEDVILVGIGQRGRSRLSRWKLSGGRVVGIVETDRSRLTKVRGADGLPVFSTPAEAFAALPAACIVDICTPPSLHREHALVALANDRHVLCEKPFTTTVAAAEEVFELARSRGKQVGVFYNYLLLPPIRHVVESVRSGSCGSVVGAHVSYADDHRGDRQGLREEYHWVHTLPGGRLEETIPHLVYTLLEVLGDAPARVTSATAAKHTPYAWVKADTLSATLTTPNAIGTLFLTFGAAMERLNLQVIGSEGLSEAAGTDASKYRQLPDPADEQPRPPDRTAQVKRLANRLIETARHERSLPTKLPNLWEAADVEFMRRFIGSVHGTGEPPVKPETAIATVRLTREIFDKLS